MCSNCISTIIFILSTIYSVSTYVGNNSCPPRETCLPVRNCTQFMDFIEANRPLNRPLVKFLREQQCGFHNGEPKVCCGEIPEALKEIITEYNQNPNRLSVREVRSITDMNRYGGGGRDYGPIVDYSRLAFRPVKKILRTGKKIKIKEGEHIELR